MPRQAPFRSPFSLLAICLLVAGFMVVTSRSSRKAESYGELPGECQGLSPEECRDLLRREAIPAGDQAAPPVLRRDDVCGDVGYLCAEVEASGSLRLLRWPEDTELIRVLVPAPQGLAPGPARALQKAAVRGIRAWHGHPVPLSVRSRSHWDEADITVQWARRVEDGRLGRAQVEWVRRGSDTRFRISGFSIATHHPRNGSRVLTPEEVEIVAAHEMGHALGLPHSDDPRDVMFPKNTAVRLSTRDFRTLQALYALPNGAEIRR